MLYGPDPSTLRIQYAAQVETPVPTHRIEYRDAKEEHRQGSTGQ